MTADATIQDVRPQFVRLPLDQVLQDANPSLPTHFEIVTATVTPPDGTQGRS